MQARTRAIGMKNKKDVVERIYISEYSNDKDGQAKKYIIPVIDTLITIYDCITVHSLA